MNGQYGDEVVSCGDRLKGFEGRREGRRSSPRELPGASVPPGPGVRVRVSKRLPSKVRELR